MRTGLTIAKLLADLAYLLLMVLFYWMALGRRGKRGSAKAISADRIEFAQDWIALCGWLLFFGIFARESVEEFLRGHGKPLSIFISAAFASMALACLLPYPGTIVIDADGLEEVLWFWKNRRIRWEDIVEIDVGKGDGPIKITSKDGTKIIPTDLLAGEKRLLQEIKSHCGEQLPPDFPREEIADA